jgi:hypothetical protein
MHSSLGRWEKGWLKISNIEFDIAGQGGANRLKTNLLLYEAVFQTALCKGHLLRRDDTYLAYVSRAGG